jgi:hypothetical protein
MEDHKHDYHWEACTWLLCTSSFGPVRRGAQKVLEDAGYPYMCLYTLFGTDATEEYEKNGFTTATVRHNLEKHVPDNLAFEIRESVSVRDGSQNEDLFASDHLDPTKDPIMKLYFQLGYSKRKPRWLDAAFVQRRLNSPDRLERYAFLLNFHYRGGQCLLFLDHRPSLCCKILRLPIRYLGLICIGLFQQSDRTLRLLKQEVVPRLLASEVISDVRQMAWVLMNCDNERGGCLSRFVDTDTRDKVPMLLDSEYERLQRRLADGAKATELEGSKSTAHQVD